jgi:ABC-2 type transport system permease protein
VQATTEQVEAPINGPSAIAGSTEEFAGITDILPMADIIYILVTFIFYFLGGYLLYGAMFAAIGSAVDSETDTQQFMLPVTIPLILSIIVMINAITNPEGQLVFWFSIIPFTSPVVMMARIPFRPPLAELILSMGLLILTFLFMTWIAGKIYRTGILMYGKKASYRELFKWISYKD